MVKAKWYRVAPSSWARWCWTGTLVVSHRADASGRRYHFYDVGQIENLYLQLSNDAYTPNTDGKPSNVNIHVTFPTTPAQYFHLLRRQIQRNFRKPLIVAGPKALLRLSAASSSLSELSEDSRFQPVLDDPIADANKAKRVVLLSGKIYYDLVKQRETLGLNDAVAFIRLEELSPFPFKRLADTLKRYTSAKEIMYLQEEPRNQGAYTHVASRIQPVFEEIGYKGTLAYRGRKESALPAPGIGKLYSIQQKSVIDAAFDAL
ncbi:hypothetical protein H0H87_009276 [Tephrocybe sp. NHM501043]|nr:hypothetical protein H0H87_009276 [Tephrocybe sp. NHM501043]